MADMGSAAAAAGGEKRKYKENAFTAKAESGSLRVKIMRRDQQLNGQSAENGTAAPATATEAPAKKGRGRPKRTRRPPPPSDSPPKPRPNRKHVPIFYEQHHRQQIQQRAVNAGSSSTDESAGSSTTTVPGIHSTSSTENDVSVVSASSAGSEHYSSLLSELRLQPASGGAQGAPPPANPLFSRHDSGTLGDLLRPYFPHSASGSSASFPLAREASTGTASSAGLLLDHAGGPSALHQLAASSASYRSALDALSAATLASGAASQATSTASTSTATTAAASSSELATSASETPWRGTSHPQIDNYRFNPLDALQSAIDHAHRVALMATAAESHSVSASSASMARSSASTSTSSDQAQPENDGNLDASSRYYRLEPSEGATAFSDVQDVPVTSGLGALPDAPPPFAIENSLTDGGMAALAVQAAASQSSNVPTSFSSSTRSGSVGGTRVAGSEGSSDAGAELGAPPDSPPSFTLQNSLMGGGISSLGQSSLRSSLERLRAKAGIAGGATSSRATGGTNACLPTSVPVSGTSSSPATRSEKGPESSSLGLDLGSPPSGPPAFTIGNSLMGGGIELQPAAAAVNTHNFDWKLHRQASAAALGSSNDASNETHKRRSSSGSSPAEEQPGRDKEQ